MLREVDLSASLLMHCGVCRCTNFLEREPPEFDNIKEPVTKSMVLLLDVIASPGQGHKQETDFLTGITTS